MVRILLTWELGAGLGHAMNLRPLAAELARRGHSVFIAAKDLTKVRQIFGSIPVKFLQAPSKSRPTARVDPIVTFADLLFNIGFGDKYSLSAHVEAWQNLFALLKPDLVVCDHSPTALLATRGGPFAVTTIGTGFFCPIDESPLRNLRKIWPEHVPIVRAREARVLENMNWVLSEPAPWRRANRVATASLVVSPNSPELMQSGSGGEHRLNKVTELYHDGRTKHFMLTFPELDHYTGRTDGDYRGAWPYGLPGQ